MSLRSHLICVVVISAWVHKLDLYHVRYSISGTLHLPTNYTTSYYRTLCQISTEFSNAMTIVRARQQCASGLVADTRHLGKRAAEEAQNFKDTYGSPVGLKVRCPYELDEYCEIPNGNHER
jgi:hypothetical protein